ncbi:MAG TPA: hypothetical protein VFW00_02070 [Rhodocyclaceae bacterium]|nr:hypothetical protein [Rhodocyclaceae bacterium]
MNMRRYLFVLCMIMPLASGCGTVDKLKGLVGLGRAYTPLRTLKVSADADANQGNGTQLDIVLVFDSATTDRLPKTGPDWFNQRDALQRLLATGIEVVSLQIPGSTPVFSATLPARITKATSVFAYANYVKEEGWPVIALTPYRSASLRLTSNNIVVSGN